MASCPREYATAGACRTYVQTLMLPRVHEYTKGRIQDLGFRVGGQVERKRLKNRGENIWGWALGNGEGMFE